ncbi:MAG: leucine-rich repeat domain-containing protein [Eggerthellaceae bacterium]|nr:leucine-rich repeat domain-containing protein [Eggerthellaceae bacterium]MCH4220534.1 leucine-rich repeat domain-containing protein [Eggerthellaceae bacterium]
MTKNEDFEISWDEPSGTLTFNLTDVGKADRNASKYLPATFYGKFANEGNVPVAAIEKECKKIVINSGFKGVRNGYFLGTSWPNVTSVELGIDPKKQKDTTLAALIASTTNQSVIENGITYSDSTKTTILAVDPTYSSINIPASVTKIPSGVFNNCNETLKSITVDEGNTVLFASSGVLYTTASGGDLIYSPKGLEGDVAIPEGITTINASDYNKRPGIASLSLPSTLTKINFPDYLFSKQTGLQNVFVAPGNSTFKYSDGVLYGDGGKTALCSLPSISGDVIVPNGVESIGNAFAGKEITSITLPASLASLNKDTFYACPQLTTIKFPDTIKSIALDNCPALTSLDIPASVTNLSISDCSGLTSLNIPDGVTSLSIYDCPGLASLDIPASVTSISYLSGCAALKSITVADGGHFHFDDGVLYDSKDNIIFETKYPNGRDYVTFPKGTTTATLDANKCAIGNSFINCYSTLETIVSNNPDYVVVNGVLFSSDMKQLIKAPTTLTGTYIVPDSVTNIAAYAFAGCTKVNAIVMPDAGVKGIGAYAFAQVPLQSIQFPSTLWKGKKASDFIADAAQSFMYPFLSLTNATCISLPSANDTSSPNVNHTLATLDFSLYTQTFLPNYMFSGLYGLTEISLPKNIMSIGNGTFYACPNLKNVYAFNQNLQIATAGETGDSSLGWVSNTPSSFSSIDTKSMEFTVNTGMTFYGLNYTTNTTKAYADKYGCTFKPFAFLGNYSDPAKLAQKIEGGTSTLNYLTSSNTASIASMTYTGSELTPTITVDYAASSDPAVAQRTLSPGNDCTVVYKDSAGNVVSKIVNPGTYTATITGDEKSVFGTTTASFTVVGPAGTSVKMNDVSGTGITANGSLWGSNVDGKDASNIQLVVDPVTSGDAYNKLAKTLGDGDLLGMYNIFLMVNGTEVHDNFGTLTLSFPVDSTYNGRTVTIQHLHKDGSVTSQQSVVANGKIKIVASDLSDFSLEVKPVSASTTPQAAGKGSGSTTAASGQTAGQQLAQTAAQQAQQTPQTAQTVAQGAGTTTQPAAATSQKSNVKTGDVASTFLWTLVLLCAGSAAAAVGSSRRRKAHVVNELHVLK